MRKRTPAKRTYKPGSEAAQLDELMGIQRALREYERDGHVSDPVLAARIRDGWRPSVEMALWAIQPNCPDGIRAICLKTLVEREPSKVELMRLADGGDRAPTIQIQIASWAAAPESRRAIELQPAVDGRQTNSGPPAAELTDEDKLRSAARASATVEVVDVPPGASAPRKVVGEVSMRSGLKRRPVEPFEPRAHEAAPDTRVDTDSKLFGR